MRDIRSDSVVSDLNGYYDCQNIVGFPSGRMVVMTHRSATREGAVQERDFKALLYIIFPARKGKSESEK